MNDNRDEMIGREYNALLRKHLALQEDCKKVLEICKLPAGNRRFMQIAEPARRIINILKPYFED